MIPTFGSLLRPPPEDGLVMTFPGAATTASMGTGDSIVVSYNWAGGSVEADLIRYMVYKVGAPGLSSEWAAERFTATTTRTGSDTFSSADTGWDGAGTYKILGEAWIEATGPMNISAEITLTVS